MDELGKWFMEVFTSINSGGRLGPPAAGYEFDYWGGDVSGSDNPVTIDMDSDKKVTAHFKAVVTYSLSVSVEPSGGGTVTLSPPGGNYPAGTEVVLMAVPAPGYSFDHWSGDTSGSSPTVTITMDSDRNVTAHFKRLR